MGPACPQYQQLGALAGADDLVPGTLVERRDRLLDGQVADRPTDGSNGARLYRQRCEKHGAAADQALLAPVIAAFNRLQGQKTEEQ